MTALLSPGPIVLLSRNTSRISMHLIISRRRPNKPNRFSGVSRTTSLVALLPSKTLGTWALQSCISGDCYIILNGSFHVRSMTLSILSSFTTKLTHTVFLPLSLNRLATLLISMRMVSSVTMTSTVLVTVSAGCCLFHFCQYPIKPKSCWSHSPAYYPQFPRENCFQWWPSTVHVDRNNLSAFHLLLPPNWYHSREPWTWGYP